MKKRCALLVGILVSLAFIFSASADSSGKDKDSGKECQDYANITSTAFGMKTAGKNRDVICAELNEAYHITSTACDSTLQMVEAVISEVGQMPTEEVKSLMYEFCLEERKNQAKYDKKAEDLGTWAKKEDLVGAYELVQLPAKFDKFNKVSDPFEEKYQWFVFGDDGSFKIIVANRDLGLKSKKDVLDVSDTIERLPRSNPDVHYRFLKDGFFVLYHKENPNKGVVWSANIIKSQWDTGRGMILEVGDILLGLDKNGERVYLKQLRRLKN